MVKASDPYESLAFFHERSKGKFILKVLVSSDDTCNLLDRLPVLLSGVVPEDPNQIRNFTFQESSLSHLSEVRYRIDPLLSGVSKS